MNEPLHIFQSPVSILLGVAFILVVYIVHYCWAESKAVRVLAGWKCGAVVMSVTALFMAIEGVWGLELHTTLPFLVIALMLQLCLELAVLSKLRRGAGKPKFSFIATHLGMFLVSWGAFWGTPDVVEANITVDREREAAVAITERGRMAPLPFTLKLSEFNIDYYSDGTSPKQYTSQLVAKDMKKGAATEYYLTTSVNHPCRFRGYLIYQESYDRDRQAYSVLHVARDPWLPVVYLGMILLMAGSALMLSGRWKRRVLIPSVIVLAVIFAGASIAKINFGTLPPALRSLWFVPHLIVYMVAYSAMAISVILALAALFRSGSADTLRDISDRLLRTSSVLLLAGMLCGCVWAKRAWGDYWAWDPKECWAAVTWLLTLVYMHLSPLRKKRGGLILAVLLLSFLSLQITWYGVNYLPSAQTSMHTYNQ